MRGDDMLGMVRGGLAAPVTPLRGLVLLIAAALAGTVALGAAGRGGEPPSSPLAPVEVVEQPVVVHVAGEVRRPGLYRLPGGTRVADAVEAAGGATEAADLAAVNLARLLEDGERLLVPSAAAPGAQPPGGVRSDGTVDLNRATTAELDALPGIGPVLAARIVAYREQRGGFRSVSELRRVQGIGEKLYRSLAELVAI